MALADRTLYIDNASASPIDVGALVIGGAGDLGGLDLAQQDLTGPVAVRPRRKLTGFITNKPFSLEFEYTSTVKTAFYNGAAANNPRTVTMTWASSDSYACECNIVGVQPKTEPGENAITSLVVDFDPTGAETIV